MSAHIMETSGGEESNSWPRAKRVLSATKKRSQNGSLAMLAGSAMFAWALKTRRESKGRAALQALASPALLAIGIRQRKDTQGMAGIETEEDIRRTEDGEKKVSDDAHAESHQDLGAGRNADESRSVYQSGPEFNPRGMTDRSDVEADQEGDIHFVEGEKPGAHRGTHLENDEAHDTRLHPESDDKPTEVDLSTAAMADEASEAAGPHSEQSYPAREGTDPEPTSEKAPERVGEGAIAPAGPEDEEDQADDESETESDESEDPTDSAE